MISVIIPTFKNKNILVGNLKHNISFLKDYEIIVVNDSPEDNLYPDLKDFKNLVLLNNKQNLGFGQSVNKGIKKAKNKFVMLLNDDVILHDQSYKKALAEFKNNRNLFAVTFSQNEKNSITVGRNKLFWRKGLLYHAKSDHLQPGLTAWAEGGSCMIDKDKFVQLGGFNKLYYPFYWEDIDLSYQAWKLGYQIIFDPDILVTHWHESTIGKYFSPKQIKQVAYKNQFTFIWKNIVNPYLFLKHILLLPYNLVYFSLKGEKYFVLGFIQALSNIISILAERKKSNLQRIIDDNKILNQFKYV